MVTNAGSRIPEPVGALDQAPVWSYVWPTTLNSSTIGFDADQGIVALAATSHPDFDDTPLYDEDGDGDAANDGALWHTHWVVLVESAECGGGLSVRDIPDGGRRCRPLARLPILIDNPDIATKRHRRDRRDPVPTSNWVPTPTSTTTASPQACESTSPTTPCCASRTSSTSPQATSPTRHRGA